MPHFFLSLSFTASEIYFQFAYVCVRDVTFIFNYTPIGIVVSLFARDVYYYIRAEESQQVLSAFPTYFRWSRANNTHTIFFFRLCVASTSFEKKKCKRQLFAELLFFVSNEPETANIFSSDVIYTEIIIASDQKLTWSTCHIYIYNSN